MNITERIHEVADLTGIDLTVTLTPNEDLEKLATLLSERKGTILEARSLASHAVRGTPEEFPARWEEATRHMVAALAYSEYGLEEAAFETLRRREERAAENAAWTALGMLTKHVSKLDRDLRKLNPDVVHTAEAAIAAGAADDYTRAHDIINTLEKIAGIPDLPRRTWREWVIINPPADLPTPILTETNNPRVRPHLTDEQPDHERHMIMQAIQIRDADTFADRLLIAAQHGWEITAATSPDEVTERQQRFQNTVFASIGGTHRVYIAA